MASGSFFSCFSGGSKLLSGTNGVQSILTQNRIAMNASASLALLTTSSVARQFFELLFGQSNSVTHVNYHQLCKRVWDQVAYRCEII